MKWRYLIALLLLPGPARACLNESRTRLSGEAFTLNREGIDWVPAGRDLGAERGANRRRAQQLDSLWRTHHRLADYSDYGVVLVYLGHYDQARQVFENIEAQRPGLYATAANLGTAYELLGQPRQALRWIERAVQLNPQAHEGSEWIHVNILKSRLAGEHTITSPFLLGVDFGTAARPAAPASLRQLRQLREELYYQLRERMDFVQPPDKLVGQLLFDLGNLQALTSDVEGAQDIYAEARRYGYRSAVLTRRDMYFSWLIATETGNMVGWLLVLALLGLVVLGSVKTGRRLHRCLRGAGGAQARRPPGPVA